MTGTAWPFPAVVPRPEAGDLGAPLSEGDGQSVGIYPLEAHPGWLVKLYQTELPADATQALDAMIQLGLHAGPDDTAVLRERTSWPVARVTGPRGVTVGCVIPRAPAAYRVRMAGGEERFLDVDFLAKPDETFARRGLTVPTFDQRLEVCRSIAAVGATLERHALVYSDWSYSNAFWSPSDWSAYIIDIDGCRRLRGPNISQPNWEDPLTPPGESADTYTDRYRVALLVGRCLTGCRDLPAVLHGLADRAGTPVTEVLLDVLMAVERRRRPTVSQLRASMAGMPYVRMPLERRPMPPRPPVRVPPRARVAARPQTRPVAPPPPPPAESTTSWVGVVVLVVLFTLLVIACIAAQ